MVRLLVLYETPNDIAAFEKHYAEVHIPLAKKLPGLLRYTVSRNLTKLGGDVPVYLAAELDFPDMATAQSGLQSDAGHAAVKDVQENLAPLSKITNMLFEVDEV